MRIIALFLFIGLSFPTEAQTSYTLSQCIETAWTNNLQIKQAELGLESAELDLKNAKTDVLPNLNGFATHNYNWGQRIDPFTNLFANTRVQSNSFGLSSSITLFNGFQNQENIRSQQAGLEASKWSLETQKNNMALTVASAYLQVVLAEELVAVAEEQVEITETQLGRIKSLVDAGSIDRGAQFDLEAQLGRDNSNLTQRTNDYQLSLVQLKQMMMLSVDEPISLEKPRVEVQDVSKIEDTRTIYGYAETAMPEVKQAQMSLAQMDHILKQNKSGYYPSLTLSGSIGTGYSGLASTTTLGDYTGDQEIGYTQDGVVVYQPTYDFNRTPVSFGTQLSDNFNQFIGLSLNIPIFNRNGVNTMVKQTEINRSIAEIQLEQEKQGLRQRIESAHADSKAARDLMEANIVAQSSAEKAFEFAEKRFEAGASNVVDFNNSKSNLEIARMQALRSKYDYLFKVKVLDFYMGKPLSLD